MGSGRYAAVADTGPLIHLAEIDGLAHLSVFDVLHLPDAVWSEAKRPESIRTELVSAHRHSIPPADLRRFVSEHRVGRLQAGEREALYLCSSLGVPTLLTDDLAVRRAAKRFGLTPVGSLGIIARACHLGHISVEEAEHQLDQLHLSSSLFVARTIVDLAIRKLRDR